MRNAPRAGRRSGDAISGGVHSWLIRQTGSTGPLGHLVAVHEMQRAAVYVAATGFEPAYSRLWASRDTGLLNAALISCACS